MSLYAGVVNLLLLLWNIQAGNSQFFSFGDCPFGFECRSREQCGFLGTAIFPLNPCGLGKLDVCCPSPGTYTIPSTSPSTARLVSFSRKRPAEIACEKYRSRKRALGEQDCYRHVIFARSAARYKPTVVGGVDAKPNQFGHMALVGYQSPNGSSDFCVVCGGTLISETWVLTAAHCIPKSSCEGSPNVVKLGEHDLSKTSTSVIRSSIQEIVIHPAYKPTPQYNDIALLKLDTSVGMSRHIYTACLPTNILRTYEEEHAIVTGWGKLKFGGEFSNILQEATVSVLNNEGCKEKLKTSRHIPQGILDSQLCAGVPLGDVDACLGDSGGPLQRLHDDLCLYDVIGIVSLGMGCGDPDYPGVYTRVSKFVDWIENIVWPQI